ncbi:hypothetical protein PENSPDRAFT_752194 [Peniophora sp. CONT]|nr:hypothetical protein PENSPDRAFT_752194 [Peniophora sp. CONT]
MSVMSEGDSDSVMRASMAPSDTGSAMSSSNLVLTAPSSSLQLAADLVTSNLMKLGTLSLNDFLSPPYQDPPPPEVNLTLSYVARPAVGPVTGEKKLPAHKATPLFLLNQVCSQTLGSIDPLKYEFIEDGDERQCILTITRPNGQSRSYSVVVEYERKVDAREAVAIVAVEMGALDFIKKGAPDHTLKRGLVLAPLDAPNSDGIEVEAPEREPSAAVGEIEKCCVDWRAGRVKPHWVALREFKPGPKFGCALRIALSTHSAKIYSVDATHDHFEDARSTCADEAVADGVLEFIMHGNGQKHPAPPDYSSQRIVASDTTVTAVSATSVQDYFESLPRPFPEAEFVGKKINEINPVSWLNTLTQAAKGARLVMKYIAIPDSKYGLHGFVLRLTRPGEVKSYLVDPLFPKRADAKTAVTLLAMSQGVGQWVRDVTRECEEKLPQRLKEYITMRILPMINLEYNKIWPGRHPDIYTFTKDQDAHGCIMTLKLKLDPSPNEIKTWEVPAEYRSRNDAKLAVLDAAFESGAVEFLRFRGRPPPRGYVVDIGPTAYKKRKVEEQEISLSGPKSKFKRMRTQSATPGPSRASERERLPPKGSRKGDSSSRAGPSNISTSPPYSHAQDPYAYPTSQPVHYPEPTHLPTPYATPAPTPGPQLLPPMHYSAPQPPHLDSLPRSLPYDSPDSRDYPPRGWGPTADYGREPAYPPPGHSAQPPYHDPYGPPPPNPYYQPPAPYPEYPYGPQHSPPYSQDPYRSRRDYGYGPRAHPDMHAPPDRSSYPGYGPPPGDYGPPPDYLPYEQPSPPRPPFEMSSSRPSHQSPPLTPAQPKAEPPSLSKESTSPTGNGRPPPSGPSAKARKVSASSGSSPKKRKRSESPELVVTELPSFKQQLIDFCKAKKKSSPMFANEANADGTFRVWIIVEKARMELPTQWASVSEGEDRTAKQVLKRLSGMK